MEKGTNKRINKETVNTDEEMLLDISSIDKDVWDTATILSSMAELNPQMEDIIYGDRKESIKVRLEPDFM